MEMIVAAVVATASETAAKYQFDIFHATFSNLNCSFIFFVHTYEEEYVVKNDIRRLR